jgi:hypothetical protein
MEGRDRPGCQSSRASGPTRRRLAGIQLVGIGDQLRQHLVAAYEPERQPPERLLARRAHVTKAQSFGSVIGNDGT